MKNILKKAAYIACGAVGCVTAGVAAYVVFNKTGVATSSASGNNHGAFASAVRANLHTVKHALRYGEIRPGFKSSGTFFTSPHKHVI